MMGKAVLISIRPKWCALISKGEKTVEVRTTAPQLKTPFKSYIYCTKERGKFEEVRLQPGNRVLVAQGKVIGEFICDAVEKHWLNSAGCRNLSEQSCAPTSELHIYAQPKEWLCGWHISGLVIYDRPKELGEFRSWNTGIVFKDGYPMPTHEIKRPPQSFMYVEEL